VTREHELLEEIRDELVVIGNLLLRLIFPPRRPTTIVFTDTQGVPVTTVSLSGPQSAAVPVLVADVNGNPIAGDVLDPSATVVVSDPTVCTAVLSADQTSLEVTSLNTTSTATATVSGTFGGATLTPGVLTVDTTAVVVAPAAAEIVFGTPVVADAATPTVPTVEAPVNVVAPDTSGHAPDAGGAAPGTA